MPTLCSLSMCVHVRAHTHTHTHTHRRKVASLQKGLPMSTDDVAYADGEHSAVSYYRPMVRLSALITWAESESCHNWCFDLLHCAVARRLCGSSQRRGTEGVWGHSRHRRRAQQARMLNLARLSPACIDITLSHPFSPANALEIAC